MNAKDKGLFNKFHVHRVDGRDAAGEKHDGCEYFVLDLNHDAHALAAIAAYAASCQHEFPVLSLDLREKLAKVEEARNEFIDMPETILPDGTVVPAFKVGRYPAARGWTDKPVSTPTGKPWVDINYHDACKAADAAGFKLIRETQMLALAWDISQQDANWTGGKVGIGKLFQGLHKGSVDEAQSGDYEPADLEERTWHVLSNGERIYHFAGNLYTWTFDDVQGDENGLIAKPFATDSISITTPPAPSGEQGVGYYPPAGRDWSGYALIRGGDWYSVAYAGVFRLDYGWPGDEYGVVGFRCTK